MKSYVYEKLPEKELKILRSNFRYAEEDELIEYFKEIKKKYDINDIEILDYLKFAELIRWKNE